MPSTKPRLFVTICCLLVSMPALAHSAAGMGGGFSAGFLHPLGGMDHMLAMLAVGMWGAQLGAPAIWLLPVAFPMIMAVGGVLGIVGVPMPFSAELVKHVVPEAANVVSAVNRVMD